MKRLLPFLILSGCGYVGDVRPPALHIPQAIQDLRGLQRGGNLLLEATLPRLTTDGLTIDDLPKMEVRYGVPAASGSEVNAWADGARKAETVVNEKGLLRSTVPVADLAGKEIFVAARTATVKGRWSDWGNVLALTVQPPLATPANIKPESSAEGARVTWTGDAPAYRVYRKGQGDEDFQLLANTNEAAYSDATAAYGKRYEYQLQGIRKVGHREDESEVSATAEITPVDKFPPAVPQGLSTLLAVASVEVAWEHNLDKDLRGYIVYRANTEGPFERISDIIELPAYSDRKIEAGKTYRYAVSSVDRNGNESARCEPATIQIAQ
ncbi:MAG: hypothetical protein HY820_19320 [Acidobacteria bacterium]|nr:hypothetical protein [Acidobacteriota bacterium]